MMDAVGKLIVLHASVQSCNAGRKDAEGLAIDTLDAAGLWTGLPLTSQLVKSWKYLHGLRTGDPPRAGSRAQEIKNTLVGPPPKVE